MEIVALTIVMLLRLVGLLVHSVVVVLATSTPRISMTTHDGAPVELVLLGGVLTLVVLHNTQSLHLVVNTFCVMTTMPALQTPVR
jgi:hypothetical protein